ncbi:prepilin peptidase [Vibrio astriarenae]|uniref:Prepilin peptidase n=1 Tax=Vibrio astriarenae TaxID=1481923 RepID=A0A7Z2T477_9VIBR|nr:A24 family peptidase [Vibrio astriarenae]QIA64078.1 prepilin peptidase [Vibrio astriarenae]
MILTILIWTNLVVIATYDAREHRIPNILVLTLVVIALLNNWSLFRSSTELTLSILAGCTLFLLSFFLFVLRAMAPGDVKLLGAVGCLLGWPNLGNGVLWICVATVLVGSFYAAYQSAIVSSGRKSTATYIDIPILLNPKAISIAHNVLAKPSPFEKKMVMPFAPIVVIGLSMYSYFS